jgi:uncharacterized protein YcbK (DUF882 family)
VDRRDFLRKIGVSPLILVPALAVQVPARAQSITFNEMWSRPRDLWITRPDSGESGRFTFWANGEVIKDEYLKVCHLMRDLHENKTVAMSVGLLNFQYAIQQGIRYYFGDRPYILTDANRTVNTNSHIENAAQDSQHVHAAANDGRYAGVTMTDLFKLASWFGVGGVGLYERHVHVDSAGYRRWAGSYGPQKKRKAPL